MLLENKMTHQKEMRKIMESITEQNFTPLPGRNEEAYAEADEALYTTVYGAQNWINEKNEMMADVIEALFMEYGKKPNELVSLMSQWHEAQKAAGNIDLDSNFTGHS